MRSTVGRCGALLWSLFAAVPLSAQHDHAAADPGHGMTAGVGATVFASLVPEAFVPHYGGRVAAGAGTYLNLRPGR